jgi:propionyl-CoA carboxylase beta chain
MFVTGPNVVKTVTHEDVTMEQLGGADTHAGTSGVAHFAHDSELASLQAIRELFRFVPSNNLDDPPRGTGRDPRDRRDESLIDIVPDNANKPYDMHDVIKRVVDDGEFYEVHGATQEISCAASRTSAGTVSGSSPTSRRCSRACSTSMRRSRLRASCASATRSTSRS